MISKNSMIIFSRRYAFSREMCTYLRLCSSGRSGASSNRFRYPITEVRGVRISCARYMTSSFFLCSASCASSVRCFNVRFTSFSFCSVAYSSEGRRISSSSSSAFTPRFTRSKYFVKPFSRIRRSSKKMTLTETIQISVALLRNIC